MGFPWSTHAAPFRAFRTRSIIDSARIRSRRATLANRSAKAGIAPENGLTLFVTRVSRTASPRPYGIFAAAEWLGACKSIPPSMHRTRPTAPSGQNVGRTQPPPKAPFASKKRNKGIIQVSGTYWPAPTVAVPAIPSGSGIAFDCVTGGGVPIRSGLTTG